MSPFLEGLEARCQKGTLQNEDQIVFPSSGAFTRERLFLAYQACVELSWSCFFQTLR